MADLSLQASSGAWRMFTARKADPAFRAFEQKVLQRDHYTCHYCGFQARDFQQIVNLDHDYRNNKLSNLKTACCLCAQCLFLESVGVGEYGGGTLIHLPELSQVQLNGLCHVLFCAITNNTAYKDTAQSIYRNLKYRSKAVEDKFGEGTSLPATMGQLLIEADVSKDKQAELLAEVRLLPSRAQFREQVERWAANALETMVV